MWVVLGSVGCAPGRDCEVTPWQDIEVLDPAAILE